jgi:hypothetical protein
METTNKPEAKNPIENLGVMDNEMLEASKELFLPGVFESLDLKINFTTSGGGPVDVQVTGTVTFDKLSEKGITRAKQQGYSRGETVNLAFLRDSQHKQLDIISKNGGRCDSCRRILFEEDGMLVSVDDDTDPSNKGGKTINMIRRKDELIGVDPHIKKNTKYSFLICADEKCISKITGRIQQMIREGKSFTQQSSGSGCYIATAAFGSPLALEVVTLYDFRDLILNKSEAGRKFVSFYYRFSPAISRIIKRNSLLKGISRQLLKPVILFAKFQLKLREVKK